MILQIGGMMKRFDTEITVPITVCYETVPADGDGWNHPYIPEHIEICDLEFYDEYGEQMGTVYQIANYFMKMLSEQLLEEAIQNETDS